MKPKHFLLIGILFVVLHPVFVRLAGTGVAIGEKQYTHCFRENNDHEGVPIHRIERNHPDASIVPDSPGQTARPEAPALQTFSAPYIPHTDVPLILRI